MKLRWMVVLVAALLLMGVLPAVAQDDVLVTFTYGDFSFSYDPAIMGDVQAVEFEGDDPSAQLPGGADAPYIEFLFTNDENTTAQSLFDVGGIRLYRVEDTAPYIYMTPHINAINTLMSGRVALEQFMQTNPDANTYALPFLPIMPAAQVIRARVGLLNLDTVGGISYLTAYRQEASPFTGDEFLYTFQGLSTDNQYYVSAVFRLNTELFPTELPADFDMDAFIEGLQDYFAQSIDTLNAATPDQFTPDLDMLDALFASFTFSAAAAN
ncbi:MAG: hypothetical protein IPO91_08460 [Chloroflexi bacterium]|nr:hypothetical protein [Chloroflexota bacterium]